MRHETERLTLAVFSSYGTALATWERTGMFGRETEYLRLLQERLGPTALVSYGNGMSEDVLAKESGLAAIKARPNWLPMPAYSVFAALAHWKAMRGASVLRANQLRGAWTAALASIVHRKPLVTRTGYVWSRFNEAEGGSGLRLKLVYALEKLALRRADVVIVASEADRDLLISRHGVSDRKICVVPNPIDTRLFHPDPHAVKRPGLITYVGRLEPQKGLEKLIDALDKAPRARLRIIGNGSQRLSLAKRAAGKKVEFMGVISNERLPALLRESEAFVLPSVYEGTPKALLEAMACGVPVIAAESEGIDRVITHGMNGLLVERSADGLAQGINTLLRNHDLGSKLGVVGSKYVAQRHSMEAAADREAEIVRRLAETRGISLVEPESVYPESVYEESAEESVELERAA